MTNFEKIKAMKIDELAEFIDKQNMFDSIGDDFCSNYCEHRRPNQGCKFDEMYEGTDCEYSDFGIIKKWLESEVSE